MRRIAAIAVGIALLLSACAASTEEDAQLDAAASGRPVAEMPGESTDELILPELPNLDPGVASNVIVGSHNDWDTIVGDLPSAGEGDRTAQLDFTTCHLRAPAEWVIEGSAALDAADAPVDVVLDLGGGSGGGDLVTRGSPVRFTIEAGGAFTLLVDGTELGRGMRASEESPVTKPFFEGECRIRVTNATMRIDRRTFPLQVTRRLDPLVWDAPRQTVQAIGSGVVLSDPDDPRIDWAYLAWKRQDFGLPELWLPNQPENLSVHINVDDESPCVIAQIVDIPLAQPADRSTEVWVNHYRHCTIVNQLRPDDGDPSSVPGFAYVEAWFGRGLAAELDGTVVTVESGDATIAELEAVASSLAPFRNLFAAQATATHGVDADLDAMIAEALAEIDATERGRFPVGDGFAVVATYVDTSTDNAGQVLNDVLATSFSVRPAGQRWDIWQTGSQGGGDLCLAVETFGPTSKGQLVSWASWQVAIAAERDWTIQVRRDGEWRNLSTVDGVHFKASEEKRIGWGQNPIRAVDAEGRPVRCSTAEKDPDEEWSLWQPPTARNALPLEAEPANGLKDGAVVRITGSGFYANSRVRVHMCSHETTNWTDYWDCALTNGPRETARVGPDGSFALDFEVTTTFTTKLGDQVDCRAERCVIRADGDRKYHQAGWVEIEFLP